MLAFIEHLIDRTTASCITLLDPAIQIVRGLLTPSPSCAVIDSPLIHFVRPVLALELERRAAPSFCTRIHTAHEHFYSRADHQRPSNGLDNYDGHLPPRVDRLKELFDIP